MTIPLVLFLHIGGNLILFWGLLKLLSISIFKDNRDTNKPSKTEEKQEIKRLERELKRM